MLLYFAVHKLTGCIILSVATTEFFSNNVITEIRGLAVVMFFMNLGKFDYIRPSLNTFLKGKNSIISFVSIFIMYFYACICFYTQQARKIH